jgi:SAM-dependent methyltransferase
MNNVDFDAFADKYDELLREQTGFFTADESYFARYKVDIAREQAHDEPRRVLEFGCGTGRNIAFLRTAFPNAVVMGSDVSARSLDVARKANPGVVFWHESRDEGEREAFDLIFIAGVFHHVPPAERAAVAQRVASRLTPDGVAIVFEHNPYNPLTRRIVSQCPYDEGVVLLTAGELRGHLSRSGLRLGAWGYALFFPPAWRRMLPLERRLRRVPLGGQYWVTAVRA